MGQQVRDPISSNAGMSDRVQPNREPHLQLFTIVLEYSSISTAANAMSTSYNLFHLSSDRSDLDKTQKPAYDSIHPHRHPPENQTSGADAYNDH